jgi:C1A family cysteine protease
MKKAKANVKYSLGCKKDPIDKRDYLAKATLATAIPKYSHKNYSDVLTPVKNQGHLGSCVGFGCVATDEFQRQQSALNPTIDFSEMWVYWRAKLIDEWPTEEGTDIRSALKVMLHDGVPYESYWPYNDGRTPDNKPTTSPSRWAYIVARNKRIQGYYRINDLQEMYTWLENYGPCIAGISCCNSFFNTSSDGNVPTPKDTEDIIGGHAISIVEYDRDDHFIGFKNSWGESWGDHGFGYLDVAYYDNGYFQDIWGILNKGIAPDFTPGD